MIKMTSGKMERTKSQSLPLVNPVGDMARTGRQEVSIDRLLVWAYAEQFVHHFTGSVRGIGFGAAYDMAELGVRVDTNPGGGAAVSQCPADAETVDNEIGKLLPRHVAKLMRQYGITGVAPSAHLDERLRFEPVEWLDRGHLARPVYDAKGKAPLYTAVIVRGRPDHLDAMRAAYRDWHHARLRLAGHFADYPGLLTRFTVRRENNSPYPWEKLLTPPPENV